MIRCKAFAAGQIPKQPSIHSASAQLVTHGRGSWHICHNPTEFAGRKQRIDPKARRPHHHRVMTFCDQVSADVCDTTALPDNRVVDRLAGGRISAHQRLTLVGDGDARDIGRTVLRHQIGNDRLNAFPDGRRRLLGPAVLWIGGGQRRRCPRHYFAHLVDQYHLRVGDAFVGGQNQAAHCPARFSARWSARQCPQAPNHSL